MAQKTVVSFIDDLDGESEAEGTVPFELDGVSYEIDLTTENAAALRDALAPYIAAARRTGGRRASTSSGRTGGRSTSSSSAPKRSREENQLIRQWAAKQGLELSERGRIPNEIAEKYDARELSKTPG